MIRPLFLLISLITIINPLRAETLRLSLKAELADKDSKSQIFNAEFLLPEGQKREIFTGPYTIAFSFDNKTPARYDLKAEMYSLGPDYHISEYNFSLSPGDTMLIPPQPVKNGITVNHLVTLLDDTSTVSPEKYLPSDTTYWGHSTSIHYLTHWVKGSLIDYTWNKVMSHLEFVYDRYRGSYRLSESEKINTYIYPEPIDDIYLGDGRYYSIQPRLNRIDVVYGHRIKAFTPAPACELLVYRQWGYGPRWMVTGLAHYYDDNLLKIRDYIEKFDRDALSQLLKYEDRVESDTGMTICGALAFWLLQNQSFPRFKKLYALSTVLDFDQKCEDAYEFSLNDMLDRFLNYASNYIPAKGELDYYASQYFDSGDMAMAQKYYGELVSQGQGKKAADLKNLAASDFWLGEYTVADKAYDRLLKVTTDSSEALFMKGEVGLARGEIDRARGYYARSFKAGFSTGGLRLASLYLDKGEVDSAAAILGKVSDKGKNLLDYKLAAAEVMKIHNEDPDSLLNDVVARAINFSNSAPQDPRLYVILGKAYALLGNYEKAISNFKTAHFLEISPFNLSSTLLEMGKTEDLLGTREKAREYYKSVLDSNGGEYQKSLAEKYLKSAFKLGN